MIKAMLTAITKLLAGIGNSVAAVFNYKASANVQRREAEKDVAVQAKAVEAKKAEIRAAVYNNDDAKLNQIVSKLLED